MITKISSENSSYVLVTTVFRISAPIKNSKLNDKYPEKKREIQEVHTALLIFIVGTE